jgi:hydroxyacyl-ACP dehydratase HTD2-like protein with hotdog domain
VEYQEFVGRSETRTDIVWPPLLRGLAATLGTPADTPTTLPPLGHWMLFQDWVPPDGLGPDGHPKRGGFLPPVHDLPRRMWAGGRIAFHADLRSGDPVERISTILNVEEKSGGSGRLVFVTVRHRISGPTGPAIDDEHDIVYRGAAGAAVKPAAAAPEPPAAALRRQIVPDSVLLFRYSALTGNGHRIHYDLDYVTRIEHYPGLIVHGPLQATLLARLLAEARPEARVARFAFRGLRPAFAGRPMALLGWPEDAGGRTWRLESRDADGAICMSAEASLV